ncbi:MAG: glycine zipper 2TM domain-containing protein [Burkholderiales bacterium]|nr:glycine zipper 2TM domain-containing protein [Burkholderiales bacterium]
MNANKTLIAVSTITAALAAVALAFPASADDQRSPRRGERPVMVERSAPPGAGVRRADFPSRVQSQRAQPQRVFTERPEFRQRPPVVQQRPLIVQRPVVVQRTVVVQRPTPVYYHQPRPVHAYAPAPVYYDQSAGYRDDERNPAGAIAGAVIGGVIGSQVGDGDSRGITTVIGAILGGILGSGF